MSQACSGGAKRDTDSATQIVVSLRRASSGQSAAEFREGERRLLELAAQELDAPEPEQRIRLAGVTGVEGAELGEGGLGRFKIILHGALQREVILLLRRRIGKDFRLWRGDDGRFRLCRRHGPAAPAA